MEQKQECFIFECLLRQWSLTLLLLMLSSFAGLSVSQFPSPTDEFYTDGQALLSIKSAIYDASGALASWGNTSLHFCQWQGVRCRNRGGEPRVTALKLQSLGLAGRISPSLANLTFLQQLQLSHNSLKGPIPQELSFLSYLQHLDLSHNPLGGMIPTTLSNNCSKLRTLLLQGNNLRGTIPRNLSKCLELEQIDFKYNMLTGDIPRDMCSLPKLQSLTLNPNHIAGSIPPEIGNLASLKDLELGNNNLSGTIPSTIGNLSYLNTLEAANNRLEGAIPAAIWNLTSLTNLTLRNNTLSGTIPKEIGNLVNAIRILLGFNHFSGVIPKSLGSLQKLDKLFLNGNQMEARHVDEWGFLDALTNCTNLLALNISGNHLGGVLPKSIGNLSRNLKKLYLHGNQIEGSIPAEIGNLINLTIIEIQSNLLNGTIPSALGSLSRLEQLDMSQNNFVGEIPATLGRLTRLSRLYLSSNKLYGSIPPSLGNCPLEKLNLASNMLTGTVPKEILFIPSFSVSLNVSHNLLTGSLPSEIGNLRNIASIDVSNNKLSGEIPTTFDERAILQTLYLQRNFFSGSIPSSFSKLQGLSLLDVSSNNLSGTIPDFSQLMELQVLDVSNNYLSGQIPDFLKRFHNMSYLNLSYNNFNGEVPKDGVFSNYSFFSVVGNKNLCGGVPQLSLPPCSSTKKHPSAKLILIISVAGGILCIIVFVSLFSVRSWLLNSRKFSSDNSCITEKHRKVSFAELLRATNQFSPANLIGIGSFGSVYKGTMDWEDHKVVAVKVLNLRKKGALRSFIAECEALRNIRHRNLIKILTSCSSVDFQGNDFKALVFEYLPNGNLDKWLHPELDEQGTSPMLSLIQRLNISIDVASSLVYLHHHVPQPIIHCDLKPSNVLLDHNMVAHVGDFGLARFLNKIISMPLERSTNSAIIRGSIGYAAPEYGMANKASTQGDVYSYGILLLEMFTGKRPTDDSFKEGLNLRQYVELALPQQVVEIIDPYLLLDGGEAEAQGTNLLANEASMRALECITLVLKVGLLCSKELPKERMHMQDVIRELHDIRDAFQGFHPCHD